jgi:hypothetical protein
MSCHPAAPLLTACCDAAAAAAAAAAPAVAFALLPLLRCCRAASIALPLPLLLTCLCTHNKVNEWSFIKPMTQYSNHQKTMFQYNKQQNNGLVNGHSLKTMTPYNNQHEGNVSFLAECMR